MIIVKINQKFVQYISFFEAILILWSPQFLHFTLQMKINPLHLLFTNSPIVFYLSNFLNIYTGLYIKTTIILFFI